MVCHRIELAAEPSFTGRAIRGITPGRAMDIGAAGGGNTRVLKAAGWSVTALEYGADGAEVAAERGLAVMRGDATALPVADDSLDLVVAFDVLEHIVDHDSAVAEVHRALRPDGLFLVADLPTRLARVGRRRDDASDADAKVVAQQQSYELGEIDWTEVDASGTPDDTLRNARAAIR